MHAHRLVHMHAKPKLRAQRLQLFDARLRAAPKAEVVPLVQRAHAQRPGQNLPRKLPRRKPRQRRIKRQHHHRVNARLRQQPQPLRPSASAAAAPAPAAETAPGADRR